MKVFMALPLNIFKRYLLTIINEVLALIEKHVFHSQVSNACVPVFVLGAPRCGSTLFIQVLTDAYEIGYISNLHCRWYGFPALAEKIFKPLENKPVSAYSSQYGETIREGEPSECGRWWYRFFRKDFAYLSSSDVSDSKMCAFRKSVALLLNTFGVPVIFKNLYASLRIDPIAKNLPNSLFVVLERDLVNNAQSILKGRMDAYGSYERWWSVPPPNVKELEKLSPPQQVVAQIESIYSLIDCDVSRLGLEDRVLRVRYEDFCQDVHGVLKSFDVFMNRNSVRLTSLHNVPSSFQMSHSRKIPEYMYNDLVAYIDEVNSKSVKAGRYE